MVKWNSRGTVLLTIISLINASNLDWRYYSRDRDYEICHEPQLHISRPYLKKATYADHKIVKKLFAVENYDIFCFKCCLVSGLLSLEMEAVLAEL